MYIYYPSPHCLGCARSDVDILTDDLTKKLTINNRIYIALYNAEKDIRISSVTSLHITLLYIFGNLLSGIHILKRKENRNKYIGTKCHTPF